MIGCGSRGAYLLKHLKNIASGRCVALCDIRQEALDHGVQTIGGNPQTYKDYHDLLARKDIDAVFVIVPLFVHFPLTRDALLAADMCSAKSAWSSSPRKSTPCARWRGTSQTDSANRPPAALQLLLPGGQEHGGQGHPRRRPPHPRAVASQHDQQAQRVVDHEAAASRTSSTGGSTVPCRVVCPPS